MGSHPNVILMAEIVPDDLPSKTYRAILADVKADEDDPEFKIGEDGYSVMLMDGSYDEGMQIAAKEGSIVVYDLVTYGYGERISWPDLEKKKNLLEEWAKGACERHKCSCAIHVSANYW